MTCKIEEMCLWKLNEVGHMSIGNKRHYCSKCDGKNEDCYMRGWKKQFKKELKKEVEDE